MEEGVRQDKAADLKIRVERKPLGPRILRPGVNQAALISVNLCLFLSLTGGKKLQLYLHACNRANAGGTVHVNEAKHSLSPTMKKMGQKRQRE
jgi:hypothetical protein